MGLVSNFQVQALHAKTRLALKQAVCQPHQRPPPPWARPLPTHPVNPPPPLQVSKTIWNEGNPRWNEKFDFVMVPAGAALLATVKDRTTTFEKIASLRVAVRGGATAGRGLSRAPRFAWHRSRVLVRA